eukprot:TRINITY_DN2782_c0_g1_i23.p2 TRINITY_DN2782_c0_g1~~TRINITY_DN2782_c0_g1_i23.p2  ORF type:complete len:118 (-),score=24.01 TRINITY_DN2782_c0_g1_i23:541-894(-)
MQVPRRGDPSQPFLPHGVVTVNGPYGDYTVPVSDGVATTKSIRLHNGGNVRTSLSLSHLSLSLSLSLSPSIPFVVIIIIIIIITLPIPYCRYRDLNTVPTSPLATWADPLPGWPPRP